MSLRGDAHPNSNSCWGHEYDFDVDFVPQKTDFATEEIIDQDRYEPVGIGEERFFLCAVQWGRRVTDGPAPPFPKACAVWINSAATLGVEQFYDIERSPPGWTIIGEDDEIPDAISANPSTAGEVPEEHRAEWQAVLEDAHGVKDGN